MTARKRAPADLQAHAVERPDVAVALPELLDRVADDQRRQRGRRRSGRSLGRRRRRLADAIGRRRR
jgi:hypothetical protein